MAQSALGKPLSALVRLDWEKALYIAFILLALVTRLWGLGDRIQSHDESIHTKYSWHLYSGQGFSHHPLMHGPFLFHITALSYFLFGVNDFSARVPVALMGVAIVAFPYLLRRWLGRKGALATSFFLLISPSIAYYSRYIRHDIPVMLWSLVAIFSAFSYLRDGRRRWLCLMAAGVSLAFATKEVAFIYSATLGLFLVGLLVVQTLRYSWPREHTKTWFLLTLLDLAFVLLAVGVMLALRPEEGEIALAWWTIGRDVLYILGGLLLIAVVALLHIGHLRREDLEFPRTGAEDTPDTTELDEAVSTKALVAQFTNYLERNLRLPLLVIVLAVLVLVVGVIFRLGLPVVVAYSSCPQYPPEQRPLDYEHAACVRQALEEFRWPEGRTRILAWPLFTAQAPDQGDQDDQGEETQLPGEDEGAEGQSGGILIDTQFVLNVLPFVAAIVVALSWFAMRAFRDRRSFDLIVFLGTFCLPLLSPLLMILAGLKPMDYSAPAIYYTGAIAIEMVLVSVAIGLIWDHHRRMEGAKAKHNWLIAAAVYYAIFVLLFTTILTNAYGIASGTVGSLGYWMEQQEVERGSQPMYYYGVMVSFYEYLPLLLTLVVPIYLLSIPIYYLRSAIGRLSDTPAFREYFLPFVLWWVVFSWLGYSVAGERMPWLTVHIALPMILLSGWLVGRLLKGLDWQQVRRTRAWLLMLFTPLLVVSLAVLAKAISMRPFQGHSLDQLQATGWLVNGLIGTLAFGAGLIYLIWRSGARVTRRLLLGQLQAAGWPLGGPIGVLSFGARLVYLLWRSGGRVAARVLLITALLVPVFLTIRTAWRFCYVTHDQATEFLVYAHAAPGVRTAMEQIDEIARRLGGPDAVKVAYGSDASTMFHWQLRDYPTIYYGDQPDQSKLDAPVVIAGSAQWTDVQPYLGDNYDTYTYSYIWWPMQDYYNVKNEKSLLFELDIGELYRVLNSPDPERRAPEMRAALWDIWYDRDYSRYDELWGSTHSLDKWPLRGDFRLYIRRDVAAQVWDLGTSLPDEEGRATGPTDLYGLGWQDLSARLVFGSGQLQNPRGIKVGPDGFVYVADTGKMQIYKFTADGELVAAWESGFGRDSPWDVAVAPDGSIYVADTWNHRIQKLDAGGNWLGAWGMFGMHSPGDTGGQSHFFGPRSVVIGPGERIYVADTGNKRIQVFEPDGMFALQWGGGGVLPGYLDEPVGIAIGPNDEVYVADVWNQRIQVFDKAGVFVQQWPIAEWEEIGVNEKYPYLAVDADGHVYITDPIHYRVLVFDGTGSFLLSFGQYGFDERSFGQPTGIAVAEDGSVYVTDAQTGRVLVFDPLDLDGDTVAAPVLKFPSAGAELAGGELTLVGIGEPGSQVRVLIDGKAAGIARADSDGVWILTTKLTTPGDHEVVLQALVLQERAGFEIVASSDPIWLTILEEITTPALDPQLEGIELPPGELALAGTSGPDSEVRVLIDGQVAGTARVDGEGNWSLTVVIDEPGEYAVIVQALGADGEVAAASEPVSVVVATPPPAGEAQPGD